MRVIVGSLRGRRLVAPPGEKTRPILDRVKQALFDRLGSIWGLPGDIPPLNVLDCYAGAGSLGIEALSRGARYCCFVENDAEALRCLRTNVADLKLTDRARVVAGRAESAAIATEDGGAFGLIFLDPPYPMSLTFAAESALGRTFDRLGSAIATTPDAVLVWRFPKDYTPPDSLPGAWRVTQRHDYGTMSLVLASRTPG